VQVGEIETSFVKNNVKNNEQLTDIFTKHLTNQAIGEYLEGSINLYEFNLKVSVEKK
jgi:hypothetical protein